MECSRVEMLKKIQCSNFAAYDMLLYLDTHSDDKKAFRMFQALVKKTKELKCEYEEKFGPLNQFSTAMQDEFNWLDTAVQTVNSARRLDICRKDILCPMKFQRGCLQI